MQTDGTDYGPLWLENQRFIRKELETELERKFGVRLKTGKRPIKEHIKVR